MATMMWHRPMAAMNDVATTSDQWRQQHPTNGDHDVAADIRPMAAMISYNIDMTPNKPVELHGKALARRLRGGLRCRGLQLLGKIFSISLFCSRRTGAQLEARRNKRHVGVRHWKTFGPIYNRTIGCGVGVGERESACVCGVVWVCVS